jgi:Ca2+:H+ antiporter
MKNKMVRFSLFVSPFYLVLLLSLQYFVSPTLQDLSLGVAVGSCTQIALFVVPLTVLVGWLTDKPMQLNFPHFEIILYVLSIFTVTVCFSTSKSNWLEGSLLITVYIFIAIGFWFEKVLPSGNDDAEL